MMESDDSDEGKAVTLMIGNIQVVGVDFKGVLNWHFNVDNLVGAYTDFIIDDKTALDIGNAVLKHVFNEGDLKKIWISVWEPPKKPDIFIVTWWKQRCVCRPVGSHIISQDDNKKGTKRSQEVAGTGGTDMAIRAERQRQTDDTGVNSKEKPSFISAKTQSEVKAWEQVKPRTRKPAHKEPVVSIGCGLCCTEDANLNIRNEA
jgi:acyl-CoA-binding protein